MKILAIESSCDETAAAVIQDGRKILSNVIDSQVRLHAEYGGVVPEIASRKHVEAVSAVVQAAMEQAKIAAEELDAVAATCGPGLIGALLIGANFGKAFAFGLGKPFIPVHHIRGHIAATYLAHPDLEPPFLCLVISGGHSLLVHVRTYTEMEILGGTRDDAAGEAFDKVARVVGIGYPGGPQIDRLARQGDPNRYVLPVSHVKNAPLDFSFSGLKTAVINLAHNAAQREESLEKADLCACFNAAVVRTLLPRLELAARQTGLKKLVCAGGVAANSQVREGILSLGKKLDAAVYLPPLPLCSDNGAMIGSQAYYEYLAGHLGTTWQNAYATVEICENICEKNL